jgi:hypothetical protein
LSIDDRRLSIADHDARALPGKWRTFFGAAAVLIAFVVLCQARFWRPDELFTITENIQIGEAQSWWMGRLDLPERKWDSALYNGRVYSHFPPMFSFIAAAAVPFFGGVPHWFIVLVIVLPVPLLAYALFLRRTGSALWGAFLAIGLVCGTSALPVLDKTLRGCSPYYVNQTLATAGILLFLCEFFGQRRVWPAAVGIATAALSRQLSIAYLIPLGWLALTPGDADRNPNPERKRRAETPRRRLGFGGVMAVVLGTFLVVAAVPMTLNALKFETPLESGYRYIYAGRTNDRLAEDAQRYGLFSPHFLTRNLYYAHIGPPELHKIEIGGEQQQFLRPNPWGTGIWWTTPLLGWLFVDGRRLMRDRAARVLLSAAALVFVALMLFHNTGYEQRGFNRYSLDYLPALIALIAPGCLETPRRRWLTAGVLAWSVLYFAVLLPRPNIRIW